MDRLESKLNFLTDKYSYIIQLIDKKIYFIDFEKDIPL